MFEESISTNNNMFNFLDEPSEDEKVSDNDHLETPLLNDSLDTPHCTLSTSQPMDNDAFLNYFMKIDFSTNFFPAEEPEKKSENVNISSTEAVSTNHLSKKTPREDEDILVDELTNIVYNKNEDPVAFRKAKKRIQNRQSAQRMKKLKQEATAKTDNEINLLRIENERLLTENKNLKREKVFLIEQIKVMQSILKESEIKFIKPSLEREGDGLYYNGAKQIKTKIFNVFCICLLSMVYISGEYSFSEGNEKSTSTKKDINLNGIEKRSYSNRIWNYISIFIFVVVIVLLIPWIQLSLGFVRERMGKKRKNAKLS